jgi:hypothetical protein
MKKVLSGAWVVGFATLMTTACAFDHQTSVLVPTSADAVNNTPPAVSGGGNSPGAGATSTPSLVGTYVSASAAPTLPDPKTCGNFQYQIASQTPTSISGTFTGQCGGGLTISGSATGTLNGTAVTLTATGTASMPGIPNCPFTLTGNGTVEDNGNTLRMPFTGQTCLGPVSGTEVMRRPQAAAAPPTIGEPSPVSPSPNQILNGVRTTFVVANASHSGPVGALDYTFEVATDEGFTNRVGSWNVHEQPNQTSLDLPQDFSYARVYYWHVRAYDGATTGPWSRTLALATGNPPAPGPPSGDPTFGCSTANKEKLVECIHDHVNPPPTVEGAFEVTKRVAWALRGEGAGLLIKNGGENIVGWQGRSFAAARICYPDGHIYKVLTDVPSTNGPSWQDNDFVDRSLYVPAIDPNR